MNGYTNLCLATRGVVGGDRVIDILGYFRRCISDFPNDYVRHASLIMLSTQQQHQASQDDWIRVTSRDGFSFIVKRNVVFRSGTLRNMLDERRTSLQHTHPSSRCSRHHTLDNFTEAVQKVCPVDERYLLFYYLQKPFLESSRAAVTEKFVEFLAYKATYENVQSNEEIPDFLERIAPEIALEL